MRRKMGEDCNVNHVHPHKFRRTMATTAIDKGMPIEQVQSGGYRCTSCITNDEATCSTSR